MKKSIWVVSLILLVLIIDQVLKIWIKTTFCYGEERLLWGQSWARLNFVENPGMAFGWVFGGEFGKLALSLFRLVAIFFLIIYVIRLIKKDVPTGLLTSFSLILAGAIGNMIDSAFYGLIFTNSDYHCATGPAKLVAMGQGYSSFLHGKVVDMLFFPLWRDATGNVVFFQPVFNIADSAITVGVISILLFHRQYFSGTDEQPQSLSENSAGTPPDQLDVSELENTEDSIETEETSKSDEEKKED